MNIPLAAKFERWQAESDQLTVRMGWYAGYAYGKLEAALGEEEAFKALSAARPQKEKTPSHPEG